MPVMAMGLKVTVEVPEFWTVTVWTGDWKPTDCDGNVTLVGVMMRVLEVLTLMVRLGVWSGRWAGRVRMGR